MMQLYVAIYVRIIHQTQLLGHLASGLNLYIVASYCVQPSRTFVVCM